MGRRAPRVRASDFSVLGPCSVRFRGSKFEVRGGGSIRRFAMPARAWGTANLSNLNQNREPNLNTNRDARTEKGERRFGFPGYGPVPSRPA